MKISCQSCAAKYTIADEKIAGKIVKIRCKKCGATIVANGNETVSTSPATVDASNFGGNVFDYTAQPSWGGETWMVNVADGDQRTLSVPEIITEYRAGVIHDDTYCWKDGMTDWLPLHEIGELHAACTLGPRPTLNFETGAGVAADPLEPDNSPDEATHLIPTPGSGLGALFGTPQPEAAAPAAPANVPAPAPVEPAPAPAAAAGQLFGSNISSGGAARRAGGRAGGADLFGGVEKAGGEFDTLGKPSPTNQGIDLNPKLTGQRNESSVLFSLEALTNSAPAEKKQETTTEGSGLIDIRALGARAKEPTKASGRADDIMNLAGGGAFSAALAAPVLAPAALDTSSAQGGSAGGTKKTIIFAILGGSAFIAATVVAAVVVITKQNAPPATDTAQVASTTASATATASSGSAPPTAPPTDTSSITSPGTSALSAPTDTSATGRTAQKAAGGAGGSGGGAKAGGGNSPAAATPAATPPPQAAPAAAAGPSSFEDALKKAAGGGGGGASAGGGGGDKPFDRGAAIAALGAAASAVASCKKPDGPTGGGHVKVTFAPNGSVTTADVDQPPFAGTAVGGCVASKFRAAHIPAFSGSPVSVGKSFSIN